MVKGRLIGLACAAMLPVLSVASSAGLASDGGVAKPLQTVTLRFQGIAETQVRWTALLANFQRAYPNITLNATWVPVGSNAAVYLTQLRAGNEPDVLQTFPGNFDAVSVFPLASEGALLDLKGSPWIKRLTPALRVFNQLKGKVFGAPISLFPSAIPYDLDQLKALGIQAPPKSWAEVLSLCAKAKAAGKVAYAPFWGTSGGFTQASNWLQQSIANYVYSHDPFWTAKRNAGKVKFATSPFWQRMLQSLVDMKNAGCFPAGQEGITLAGATQMVVNGQSVAFFGSLPTNLIAAKPSLNLASAILPPSDGSQFTTACIFISPVLVASARTKVPDAVRTFINFVSRPKQAVLYAKQGNTLTSFDLKTAVLPPTLASTAPLIKAGKVISYPILAWPSPTISATLQGVLLGLITGQRSVDEILTALDKAWDTALGRS